MTQFPSLSFAPCPCIAALRHCSRGALARVERHQRRILQLDYCRWSRHKVGRFYSCLTLDVATPTPDDVHARRCPRHVTSVSRVVLPHIYMEAGRLCESCCRATWRHPTSSNAACVHAGCVALRPFLACWCHCPSPHHARTLSPAADPCCAADWPHASPRTEVHLDSNPVMPGDAASGAYIIVFCVTH